MDSHIVRSNECRLKNEEDHPPGEDRRMKRKNHWPGHGGMEEILVHRVAESVNDGHRNEQRHEEVEVSIDQAAGLGQARRFMSAHGLCCRHGLASNSKVRSDRGMSADVNRDKFEWQLKTGYRWLTHN